MGQASRLKPARLAEKLLHIREALGLSQNELIAHLELGDSLSRENISAYERDVREPSLPVLLRYARAANVWMEALVDDELDLPAEIPSPSKQEGLPRKSTRGRARK